jgi:predicted Zn-dependent protease
MKALCMRVIRSVHFAQPWLALARFRRARWPKAVSMALAAALLASCGSTVVNPVTGLAERSVMDEPAEIAEGQKGHEQVLKQYGVYANPRLQAYVNGVGQKLAAQSHRANLTWTFTVLDSTEINAFALPGGYVYITRGIMAYLDSEAELAGVIGHEIGHVTARHGAQRATRQQTAGFGVLAASVLGAVLEAKGISGASNMASQASQAVAAGYVATYSREQESQADELGAEYLARNQYNPQNMVDVIGVLKSQEQFAAEAAKAEGRAAATGANWLASHPSNDKRLADIKQIAAHYQGRYGDDARERYLQAIEGMAFGDSRAQGVVRGSRYYHEDLDITLGAPAGWHIQNTPDAITVLNGAGDAGLVVKLVPPNAGSTHEEVIRNMVKPVDGRIERRTLNGLSASHFTGTVRNAQGQSASVSLTLVSGPGGHTYMLRSLAKDQAALQRASASLQEAEGSFRALNAADRAAARPWVIKTQAMPRGGFAELARRSPLAAQADAQLHLLNGAYGTELQPKVGQLVKVVN